MAVQVVGRSLMTSDQTPHQAKSVGTGGWVVSFLPGRTLTLEQAAAALQAAEAVAAVRALADRVGLTPLETIGLAMQEPPWDEPPHRGLLRCWRRGQLDR
ncbi:hypothetical protein [Nocardia terpenica]|uniref:Uncharacterized protein n=1 Tax=Nocardia terpenica TaxID=455432 RepID=A0A164IS35_9NOCA|nr:hypothetical protein [Nocardia terpenica]ATL71197.1 hypothetical protein CRH09_38535 [Nocardia terpenica]KZM69699.1 hypothetical protein AWN90_07985 [Nocardia terpenica]MBF6062871.1 hypothetical protein [Nocardia terpenica]MBF6104994.1 hypothetical protein [Nocardia terpenica]MBF6112569.1 hypothetical protein [Nocardia terpenica]